MAVSAPLAPLQLLHQLITETVASLIRLEVGLPMVPALSTFADVDADNYLRHKSLTMAQQSQLFIGCNVSNAAHPR